MTESDLKKKIEDLVTHPAEQLSRGARFLRYQFELWRFCARQLHRNNFTAMSAALSFRTMFALIPLLIFAFLVLRSVGVVEDGKRAMRDLLDKSGFAQIVVPESASPWDDPPEDTDGPPGDDTVEEDMINVAEQIEMLVTEVEGKLTFQRLGPVGAVLLIWTALTLFNMLEHSLNRVFGAPRSRAIARRVLLFWSVLTLGPVLIVAVNYFSQLAAEAGQGIEGISWLANALGWFIPALVGMLVVAMVYKLIPNTHVKFTAAFGGACVTVPLWLVTRSLFAVYVDRFVLRGNLYGVLGAVPLFMLWLNLSWGVFLFGAQLAHTAANLRQFQQAERASKRFLGPSDWIAVMLAVARRFAGGRGPARLNQIVEDTQLPPDSVRRLLERMLETELVCTAEAGGEPGYVVARPANQVRLVDIFDRADAPPGPSRSGKGSVRQTVTDSLQSAREALGSKTLADLV